jgi:GNAT superfamily N-acetyltransferase
MELIFQHVDRTNIEELRFIAEADALIPLDYDPSYTFNQSSTPARLEFYKHLSPDDFFQVVKHGDAIIAFHIVQKIPYPPDLMAGNIVSLWVHPEYRGKGLAAQLKSQAERWGKENKLLFLQTNVHLKNARMMKINQSNGFEPAYVLLRKKL